VHTGMYCRRNRRIAVPCKKGRRYAPSFVFIKKNGEEVNPTNKEVIKKLSDYYLEHDPKLIARLLANATLDLYRFYNYENLSVYQQVSLAMRNQQNAKELQKFIKDGPNGKIKLKVIEGEET